MGEAFERALAQLNKKRERLAKRVEKKKKRKRLNEWIRKNAMMRKEVVTAKEMSILRKKRSRRLLLAREMRKKRALRMGFRQDAKYAKRKSRILGMLHDRKKRSLENRLLREVRKRERLEERFMRMRRMANERRRIRKARNLRRKSMRQKRELVFNEIRNEAAREGNLYSDYWIIITKNQRKIRSLNKYKWSSDVFEAYYNMIRKNRETVVFPKRTYIFKDGGTKTAKANNVKYEILILERKDDGDTVASFRDENGKFTDNIVTGGGNYKIIAKDEWLVEETFYICGFDYRTERKTFSYIKDEMLMDGIGPSTMRRVFTFKNMLVIQEDDDIELVNCKSEMDSRRLYGMLQKKVGENKYILFSGECAASLRRWAADSINRKIDEIKGYNERMEHMETGYK